ncbi:MAG: diguanylate cyclase (GGDEF)-like protein [Methylophilaceae bacterium]
MTKNWHTNTLSFSRDRRKVEYYYSKTIVVAASNEDDSFTRELKRAERKKSSLAIIMIDIDHFKVFNATYGHDAGDHVIKKFAGLLSKTVREEDISCRYGSKEFTLVLNGINAAATVKCAEALLEATHALELKVNNQSLGQITVSLGIAMYP